MVALDKTQAFRDAVAACLRHSPGLPEELRERAEAGLAGPHHPELSEFLKQALEVTRHLSEGWAEMLERRRDYIEEGRVSEAERDQAEADMVMFIKALSDRLVALDRLAQEGGPEPGSRSAHQTAFRHGVALVLSERLQGITRTFDKWKDVRFRRRERAEAERKASQAVDGLDVRLGGGQGRQDFADEGAAEGSERAAKLVARQMGVSQQQAQAMVSETKAVWDDLLRQGEQIDRVEATVLEISQLGQILGDQVVRQSEQIEMLYYDALAATSNIKMGNEQVRKTLSVYKAGTWNMFFVILAATLFVLFVDWLHS